ncbi:MAG TPA: branched-chain amino acid ABC transporter permease, partial [Candidatus Limnocylindrales bacterium]|nr:branched-chain amino acid ABC transporter permease [Candidatus Limnocylindrales bacterium]
HDIARLLFTADGLTVVGAIMVFSVVVIGRVVRQRVGVAARIAALEDEQRAQLRIPAIVGLIAIILVLPLLLGPFFAQVIALVALYILMAFGLNITLGLAGLLDLGFVAFFAVGAYTVGLFTSTAEYGLLDWPFWAALPFAMLFAAIFGAILGLPILSIRGDYLAIATLGFGEIIAILAGSNLLLPLLGGPRGIVNIPKPLDIPSTSFLSGPGQIYYIALVFAAIIAFIAWRLRNGRIGRAWIAIREDEDVAEATGVNLIQTKLLAYILGAAFAGLGGAVFASLVGSIFPSSIDLFVSINVAAIVIVGGMGSIPGVALGALFLIGIPELFREFSQYRFLFYGVALIAMMLYRPEGIWPSGIARRELHVEDDAQVILAGDTTPITRGTMS